MNKGHVFPFFFILVSVSSETQDSNLVVMDSKTREEVKKYLIKNTEDALELTCKLKNQNTSEDHTLSWVLPFIVQNGTIVGGDDDEEPYNGTSIFMVHNELEENNSVRITISSLQVSHSGSYHCVWISNSSRIYQKDITLIVKPRKVSCGKKFDCGDNQCISLIYKCDGVVDCRSKSDEALETCGLNPCQDRMMCGNGRCIPTEWCKVCDPLKANCTLRHRHDCCPPLDNAFPKGLPPYSDGTFSRRYNGFPDSPDMQHQYDINFIHTTVYTIIGCALVFMVIVTILVIAICRVHLKRTQPPHLLNNRRVFATTAYHRAFTQELGVYDVDIAAVNRCDGPGLLVTYNINNGVQIVGSPVDPPPYSEVASLPPREGPPPPYALSIPGDGESTRAVRSVHCETSPKPGDRPLRRGLSPHSRVSSEPSLANLNRLK